jgi:hypothetical protein
MTTGVEVCGQTMDVDDALVVFGGNGVVDGVQCGKASLGVTSAAPIAF